MIHLVPNGTGIGMNTKLHVEVYIAMELPS